MSKKSVFYNICSRAYKKTCRLSQADMPTLNLLNPYRIERNQLLGEIRLFHMEAKIRCKIFPTHVICHVQHIFVLFEKLI